jgi:hypothetical protein
MIVNKVDQKREAFSNFSLEGSILTIADIAVDLEAEQDDQEVVITFSSCAGTVHRGMMPCGEYIADVIIPPRKYEMVEVEDEELETHTENVPAPLDLDSVTLQLWPIVDARREEIKEEENGSE